MRKVPWSIVGLVFLALLWAVTLFLIWPPPGRYVDNPHVSPAGTNASPVALPDSNATLL